MKEEFQEVRAVLVSLICRLLLVGKESDLNMYFASSVWHAKPCTYQLIEPVAWHSHLACVVI